MYQLSPISLKPDIRPNRSQHGPFQAKIAQIVDKISSEKEVVDLENETAKMLFNSMDAFFAHGMYSGDKAYWRFVREFLPRTEQSMIRAEWGNGNDRRLSLAWLKDAFNKGSLNFQMLAFRSNKRLIARFYHSNACMSNGGMLEAVTSYMERIITVQFAFYSTVSVRHEAVCAVPVEPMITPKANARDRRRRITESERDCPVSANRVLPATLHENNLTSAVEQEVILNDLIRRRRNGHRKYSQTVVTVDETQREMPLPSSSKEPSPEQPKGRGLDEVLQKTLSQVRIGSLCDDQRHTFDSLLIMDNPGHMKDPDDPDMTAHGEMRIHSGDNFRLALDVFLVQNEKLQRMYQVFDRFAVGVVQQRLLAITDHNIYLLTQAFSHSHNVDFGIEESEGNMSFHSNVSMSLSNIDYIGVSFDFQVITFYPKDVHEVKKHEGNASRFVTISTGELELGKAIIKALEKAFDVAAIPRPGIFTDSTAYDLILRRFIKRELHGSPSTDIQHMALSLWRETAANFEDHCDEYSAFLFYRTVQSSAWLSFKSIEWSQSYFVLRGTKVYVYSDSSCKEGLAIYDLLNCRDVAVMDQKKDCQWGLELTFFDCNVQMQCQTNEEQAKWLQLIGMAMNKQDEGDASACMVLVTETHVVVAQEGEKCFLDEFIRPLLTFPLENVHSCWTVKSEPHFVLLIRIDKRFEWLFFRTEFELTRMLKTLGKYPIPISDIDNLEDAKSVGIIRNYMMRTPGLWMTAIDGHEEVEFGGAAPGNYGY